ncbi:hypothetical protein BH11CYA1_BH11CYA1_44440 [soil metagenome]
MLASALSVQVQSSLLLLSPVSAAPLGTGETKVKPDSQQQQASVNELLSKKQFSKAFDLANQRLKASSDAVAFLDRGNAFWSICDYRNAIKDFDSALGLDSHLVDARVHKGICQARLGDKEASLETFEEAAESIALDTKADLPQIETIGRALIEGSRLEALQSMIAALRTHRDSKITDLTKKLEVDKNTTAESVIRKDAITAGMTSFVATPHFVFIGDIEQEKLERYGAIAEGFLNFLQRKGLRNANAPDFIRTKEPSSTFKKIISAEPVSVFILHDKMAERAFLKDRLNFPHHVHGVFIGNRNLLVTYDGAGAGTYLHELMHAVLSRQKNLEYWAEEGIPCYFEKVYGGIAPEFELLHGYHENWVVQALSIKALKGGLNLAAIVNKAKHANASQELQQRLVALFLQKYDRLDAYINLTVENQHKGYKTFVEAAFDKPMVKLVPMFNDFIHEIRYPAGVQKLPPSQIFDTNAELYKFEGEKLKQRR